MMQYCDVLLICNIDHVTLVCVTGIHKDLPDWFDFSLSSGGVERDWTGVPRKLFSPGSSGVRCVCVEDPAAAEEDQNLQKYDNCPPHADSCSVEEF